MKTTFVRDIEVERKWFVVDATGQPAGRLATRIASILRGKTKPIYAPHSDTGDFVIVVNAEKVALTGTKDETKIYQHFTGYPSGRKELKASAVRERNPTRIVRQAVMGMLPRSRLGRQLVRRLHVYTGAEHPHQAQKPVAMKA